MFDYFIIGAGSAGCVLAARLSENPDVTVALLEAGPADTSVLIHCPAGLPLLARQKSTSWGFETVPQPGLNGRRGYQPRGKVQAMVVAPELYAASTHGRPDPTAQRRMARLQQLLHERERLIRHQAIANELLAMPRAQSRKRVQQAAAMVERWPVQGLCEVLLDEFKFGQLINNPGWWGNKYGLQAGVKYINVLGVDHLDLMAEINTVRPYTYSYYDSIANYSHWNQPLAHPLGSNFREYIFKLRYQPIYRLVFDGRFINSNKGEDTNGLDYGGNILTPNAQKISVDGNELLQGVFTHTRFYALHISYQLYHNLFLDLHVLLRDRSSSLPEYPQNEFYRRRYPDEYGTGENGILNKLRVISYKLAHNS